MFAAQTDFSEPGELSIFISPAQLAMLEAMMWKEGVLESRQMGGAFQLLRTYDLLWAPSIAHLPARASASGVNDLMSWNADGTRMAYRMHTDYLHQLYLNNDLAEGRYVANGEQLSLSDVTVPMFVVGTETDHVAPWRSVYKVGKLVRSTDYTFCLTSGGHNAGIISGPQHPKRRHRVHTSKSGARLLSPDRYLEKVEPQPGSWWPTWANWLEERSSARKVAPPRDGRAEAGTEAALRGARDLRAGEVISRGACGSAASRSPAPRRGTPASFAAGRPQVRERRARAARCRAPGR